MVDGIFLRPNPFTVFLSLSAYQDVPSKSQAHTLTIFYSSVDIHSVLITWTRTCYKRTHYYSLFCSNSELILK
jgi:hypothetical protein